MQREIMWLHVGEEGSEFSSEKGEFEVLRDAWMVNMQRNDQAEFSTPAMVPGNQEVFSNCIFVF